MILLVFLPQVRGVKGVFLANQKIDGKVVTRITYNRGRDWDYLRPPSVDMNGKPTNCRPVSLGSRHTPPGGGRMALLEEPRRLERVASETRTTEFLGCGRAGHGEPLAL